MGLLNNRDFDLSAFDGPFGPVLFRSPLQGDGSVGFGGAPTIAADPTQAGAFDGSAVPFGFAGPGSLNLNPPIDPSIQNLHTGLPIITTSPLQPIPVDDRGLAQDSSSVSDEAAQAQQAREAAAARLARQVRGASHIGFSPLPAEAEAMSQPDTSPLPDVRVGPITGTIRSFANAVPHVGGLNNTIEAGFEAALAPIFNPLFDPQDRLKGPTLRDRFDRALRIQNAIDEKFAQDHPLLDAAAKFSGEHAFDFTGGALGGRVVRNVLKGGAISGLASHR